MRLLIEVVSIVAGLMVALLVASVSAWAYPRGRADIWLVASMGMIATIALGAGAVWRAYKADRDALRRRNRQE